MFNSQWFLDRKGALGTIWIAAYCLKRLKKEQVAQSNISSSVDSILRDEVPLVTYRVLSFLLLGVVRIYSRKVQYMFHDCRHLLVKINEYLGRKKTDAHIESICVPYLSITRPKSFQLDAFELQIFEEGTGVHVRPDDDIILEDAWKDGEGIEHHSLDKRHSVEAGFNFKTWSTAYTPDREYSSFSVLSQHFTENLMMASPSCKFSNSEQSIEKFRGNNFSLEERLEPLICCEVEDEPHGEHTKLLDADDIVRVEEGPPTVGSYDEVQHMSAAEASIEKLRGNNFPLEESVEPMILGEVEEEPQWNKGEHTKLHDAGDVIRVEEGPPTVGSCDEDQPMSTREQIKLPEMVSSESSKLQTTTEDRRLFVTIDVTPKSKGPNALGATTPEFMAVRTPAAKEHGRVSRKRKCLCDDIIILPNKVLKESIEDAKDLVCKRRKVPHINLYAWIAQKISNLPHSFQEPLIPCSLELASLFCMTNLKKPEAVQAKEAPEKMNMLETPIVDSFPDQTDIAPSTPITCSTLLKSHDGRLRTSSFESSEEEFEKDDNDFDINLINADINLSGGDSWEMNKWSVRTRMIARFLCTNFLSRKRRKEDEVVNLSQVLEGKTKRESARLFYEILVLKTGGCVEVKQQAAYDDILVQGTPKLKLFCEEDEVSSR